MNITPPPLQMEANPYSAALAKSTRAPERRPVRYGLTTPVLLVFVLPALGSLALAWPCLDYGYTTRHPIRVEFFLYGGNALMLLFLWATAITLTYKLSRGSASAAGWAAALLAVLYIPAAGVSWAMVALGLISWT